jgi:ribonuclease J
MSNKNNKKNKPSRLRWQKSSTQNIGKSKGSNKIQVSQNDFKGGLHIIPLGGNEEVGRNMTLFEYNGDILILDMGMQFPEQDMPGIDYIIPNISYLKGKEHKIKGVILSHGHLDHIGAAPILLHNLGYPLVVGRDMTIAMVKKKMEDFQKGSAQYLKAKRIKSVAEKITLGKFEVEFFDVEHSIMDAVGVIIKTPDGTVIHPGDWTMEKNPIDGKILTYNHLSKLPSPRILMLESLGAIVSDFGRVSEGEMYRNLQKLIYEAKGKVVIGTFSSQIKRIGHILEYAEKIGKKVALDGYSMKMNMEIAKQLGYVKAHKDTLISVAEIHKYPENRIIIVCTGAQGEGNAVLSRIITDNHKYIKIKKNDTVIFSSSIIPGNERTIQRLKDSLYRKCDNVIHSDIMDVHISGHCSAQDIQKMLIQVSPQFFLPVYANHYMLKEAEKLAIKTGFPKEKIFVLDNGNILEVKKGRAEVLLKKVDASYVMVDGLGIGDVGEVVLRDRTQLAQDGILVIVTMIDGESGQLRGEIEIHSRGFVYLKSSKDFIKEINHLVKDIISKTAAKDRTTNWAYVKDNLRDKIGEFIFKRTERRPMILPFIVEM